MKSTYQTQGSCWLKKTLSIALAAVMAVTLFLPLNMQSAFAAPTSAEKQAEVDEASAWLAAAEEEMHSARANYEAAVLAHEEAIAGMEEAQGRIDEAEGIISDTQLRLGDRAASMYRQGPLNYLDVLFGASTFVEFTTSLDMINTINLENAQLIQANKEARAIAVAAHEEFTAKEKEAAERSAEAEAIKDSSESLIAEYQALVSSLEAEVAELVEQEQAARLAAAAAATESSQSNSSSGGGGGNGFTAPAPPSGGYGSVLAAATSRIGCPYVWGASGPNSFDCSGLTSWSYSQAGFGYIGRTDMAQYSNASARWAYSDGGAEVGDILWWSGHVAIYAGGGSYVHAPSPGYSVCYSSWNINNAVVLRF